jgi:ferritin-like metal-binding protein YciE
MPLSERDVLITGLKNAYALESQAADITEAQANRLTDYPELQQRVAQHHDETIAQRDRLEQCLADLGETPSALKDLALRLGANLKAMFHASADDEVLKAAFANASFEHYEIAAYKSLIVLAERCGETKVAEVCRRNLEEEEAMAEFIDGNIETVTLAYLAQATNGAQPRTGVM